MKPVLYAISVSLILSFASSAALAYSGSECEVNDCSSNAPSKANSKAAKGQAKNKADANSATKGKPAAPKEQAKDKLMDKVPAQLQGLTGLLK